MMGYNWSWGMWLMMLIVGLFYVALLVALWRLASAHEQLARTVKDYLERRQE